MTTTLVYVHGTNGSGKSTLARAVALAAGGFGTQRSLRDNQKAKWTDAGSGTRLVFVGKYGNACGGVDGVSPYADVLRILWKVQHRNVFAEGLITPGAETCQAMSKVFDQHLFIALTTPISRCVENVMRRRIRAGNTTPFNPHNLIRKAESVLSWGQRLEAAGLSVEFASYDDALSLSTELLGLESPSVTQLLE